jgi:hypothetical protein
MQNWPSICRDKKDELPFAVLAPAENHGVFAFARGVNTRQTSEIDLHARLGARARALRILCGKKLLFRPFPQLALAV